MRDFITEPKTEKLYFTFDYVVGQIVVPLHIHLFLLLKNWKISLDVALLF